MIGRQRDEDRANRFVQRATAGPGNAGDSERVVRAGLAARTFSHLANDGFTDRAMLRERLRANAEKFCFASLL